MKIIPAVILIFFLVFPLSVHAKKPHKERLLKAGGQVVEGTVAKVGAYNFHIEKENGDNINFHTDKDATRFIPEDERLMVGDLVSVVYFEPMDASRSIDKSYAMLIEFKKRVDREFLEGDITCLLSLPEFRNGMSCLIPETGQLIRFEGKITVDPYLKPGSPIKINIRAVPARIGNGYVYIAGEAPDFRDN